LNNLHPIDLKHRTKVYPEILLKKWRTGDYSMLTESRAPDFIKDFLILKLTNRKKPGRRFFGEAYISSTIDMVYGWYTSYKWLTSKKWITGKGLNSDFERPFYHALMKHIGIEQLIGLQNEARNLFKNRKDEFYIEGKYKRPVAPDLWIIDREGCFNFIESKLPGDSVGKHQLVGLALIEKWVGAIKPVSVTLMELYPEE